MSLFPTSKSIGWLPTRHHPPFWVLTWRKIHIACDLWHVRVTGFASKLTFPSISQTTERIFQRTYNYMGRRNGQLIWKPPLIIPLTFHPDVYASNLDVSSNFTAAAAAIFPVSSPHSHVTFTTQCARKRNVTEDARHVVFRRPERGEVAVIVSWCFYFFGHRRNNPDKLKFVRCWATKSCIKINSSRNGWSD